MWCKCSLFARVSVLDVGLLYECVDNLIVELLEYVHLMNQHCLG